MKNIVQNGEDLTIVGIVQPKEGVTASMLQTGIYYPASLTTHVIENAANSKIVKAQLEKPEVDVFTGKRFDDTEENNSLDMNSLIEVDTNAIKSAFKIDESKVKVDFGNLNNLIDQNSLPTLDLNTMLENLKFSFTSEDIQKLINELLKGYEEYVAQNPESDVNQISKQLSDYLQSNEASELLKQEIEAIIKENGSLTITQEQMQRVMLKVLQGYEQYVKENNLVEIEDLNQYLMEYLSSEQAKEILSEFLSEMITEQKLDEQISKMMTEYMQTAMKSMTKNLEAEMQKSISSLSQSITSAISIDEKAFVGAFKMKMDEQELSELLASFMTKENATYEGNLQKLNYASLEEPSSISIYPKDFEGNQSISNLLNEYNNRMREEGAEDKVISYTDMVGTLMSSVTTIIDTISYVLIAFIGISLVVSSIMIGVITYISVLERKKEIGILRAIGASKHNVAQVFNAETFIIGTLAGVIGIGVTLLLTIPINQLISFLSNGANVRASLPVMAGVILVILSIVLTLIGGIIPSKKAAKEDPVLALRSE